ncbi:MAG: ABC transporter permease [Candidatus Aminicenantes bacterium]
MWKIRRKSPPHTAQWILSRLSHYEKEHALSDVMESEYSDIRSRYGAVFSWIWYWFCTFGTLFHYIKYSLYWRFVMFGNYLKITLRTIRRHKGFSFINIVGLAVGMACVFTIMLWVRYELSFDRHHENAERIFRVASESHEHPPPVTVVVTPPPMAEALEQEIPEIASSARLSRGGGDKLFSYNEKYFYESFYAVDPSFFEIFTFDFVEGDAGTAFDDPYSLVLTKSMAGKFFGNQNPIGKVIQLDQRANFTITGVIKDIPLNSHLNRNVFIPFETWGKLYEEPMEHWRYWSFYTYILLRPNVDSKAIEAKFAAFAQKHGIPNEKLFLQPLLSIHLHSHFIGELSPNTHLSTLLLFGAIAVLILIIACINYMNLTTARSSVRLKEISMRKVIGAHRSQISRQFFGESLIMALFSLLISVFLVYLFLPLFNSLAERNLALTWESLFQILPGIVLLVLFAGMIAGSYPAVVLSSYNPQTALRGSGKKGTRKKRVRNVLVVVQFAISIILITATFLVKDQIDFIRDKEMGFDREQIVVVPLYDPQIRKNPIPILDELKRNPQIRYAASSLHLPNNVDAQTPFRWQGKQDDSMIWVKVSEASYDFPELFGIEIIEGRSFSRDFPSDENGAFLVNEQAMKVMGDDFHLGMGLSHWGSPEPSGHIVGVMKDFHQNSVHEEIGPLYIALNPNRCQYLSLKIQGGRIPDTISFIRKTVEKFSPKYPFEYRFFDDIFNMAYVSEQKLEKVFSLFAAIAIFIASMGVFGLSAFLAEQKRKEIGIRKVLGASIGKIVYLLSKDLMWLVLIAHVLSWPVVYYAMNWWLQNFAYRTNIHLGAFLLSSALILLVSYGTLSFQAIKAARANPVDSLKYE